MVSHETRLLLLDKTEMTDKLLNFRGHRRRGRIFITVLLWSYA